MLAIDELSARQVEPRGEQMIGFEAGVHPSTRCRLTISSAAPTTRTSDNAISAVTRTRRDVRARQQPSAARLRLPTTRHGPRDGGQTPNATPVASASSAAPATRLSTAISPSAEEPDRPSNGMARSQRARQRKSGRLRRGQHEMFGEQLPCEPPAAAGVVRP